VRPGLSEAAPRRGSMASGAADGPPGATSEVHTRLLSHRLNLTHGAAQARARYALAIAYFAGLIIWELRDGVRDDLLGAVLSLLTMAYLGLILSAYLRRGPAEPLQRAGWFSQTVAIAGANLLMPLSWLPAQYPGLEVLAIIASVVGLAFSFWALWHLGTAFTIAPEARRLVQTGPYRWVRHPLYLAGFVIGLGLLLVNLSPSALGLFLAFACSQLLRIGYEEQVLGEALPEYHDYQQRTWALLPMIW